MPYAQRALRMVTHPSKAVLLGYIVCIVLLSIWWQLWKFIDVNTYYYSYSTIAQTLAGAFAFLVAVALFRMGNIDSEMERAINEVIPYAAASLRIKHF